MKKRVRINYMKLVLPVFAAGLLICALLLAISGFEIRYAFTTPLTAEQLQETGLEGTYASAKVSQLEGTFARYGLPAEEGETEVDVAQRFCVLKIEQDKYIGVRISDQAELDTVARYFSAVQELGEAELESRSFGTLTGTINPMSDELYDFFCQWGEQVLLPDEEDGNPFASLYTTGEEEPLSEEDTAYLQAHMLPLMLDVGYLGSKTAATVYVLTAIAAVVFLASLALLLVALCGRFDRSVRALLRRDGAAAVEQDYAAGKDYGKHLRICPEHTWWFKRVGTEVFQTKDVIWAYPRSRRLEGGKVVWLLVMKTEDRREYSVLLGPAGAVEDAISALDALCPTLSVGFDKEKQKQKLFDKDIAGFKGLAKKERAARLAEKQRPAAPTETEPTAE